MKVSKSYIISIDKFMANYLDVRYDGSYKFTHYEMVMYLKEKNKFIPRRVNFNRIGKSELLSGKYLLVKDADNRVVPYLNPVRYRELIGNYDEEEMSRRRSVTISSVNHDRNVGEMDFLMNGISIKISKKKTKRYVRSKKNRNHR